MPVLTLGPLADVSALTSGEGAGLGNHLPVGFWSGIQYRSAVRFALPAWLGWSSITSATLTFYTSDFYHVGPRNSTIYIRRSTWTKAEGTSQCDTSFSSSNATKYSDIPVTLTHQVSFSSGTAANSKKVVAITALVQDHWAANTAPCFVFDPGSSSDYSEFWSKDKGSTYDMVLTITYVDQSPPTAPDLNTPANGSTLDGTLTPTFAWTHHDPQNDPQVNADIELYQNDGVTLINTYHPVGPADATVVGTDALTRGLSYKWRARTYDAGGAGAWAALATFTVRALPVVTLSPTRVMAFDAVNHQPRLVVNWTSDQPQASYRVTTASGYDSGVIAGGALTHTLSRNLVNGTAEVVTVAVTSTFGVTGSAAQTFTPRWGLTTHRRDLGSAPVGWLAPTIVSTVPTGASLVIEYGSDPAANAAPASGWFSDISAAPVNRYLFWRGWFLPSATAGPTLETITIPANLAVTLLDKWGTTRGVEALAVPWAVDTGTAVYGTRSITVSPAGVATRCYAFPVQLRAGRSYILTGLMKSVGAPNGRFQLEDGSGNVLIGGGITVPVGPVQSPPVPANTDWYTATGHDTNRYKTPVYVAAADMTVYVVLYADGPSGSKAWWDAIKLEESTVATPWSPGAIGATIIDAGGVQIDNTKGGVFRYKGSTGGVRDVVEGGPHGLIYGTDTEVNSPATGVLAVGGVPLRSAAVPVTRVYTAGAVWNKPVGLLYVDIECVGGGGAGGGALTGAAGAHSKGGGGGGGGYSRRRVLVASLGATETVTVGAGGTGVSGAAGNAGADTSFGAWCIGKGASGGQTSGDSSAAFSGANGGGGGVAGTGDMTSTGSAGGYGFGSGALSASGPGGSSAFGGGATNVSLAAQPASQAGNPAGANTGGGGSGAARAGTGAAAAGGAGGSGVVIVTEYYA